MKIKNFKKYMAASLIGATLASSAPALVLAEQSKPVQAFSFEEINYSVQDQHLDMTSFKSMVENFVNEVISHEADIKRIRKEYFNEKDFSLNTQEFAKNVCSLVYVANFSHFDDALRAEIVGTYVPTDPMEVMMNMLSVTNICNSYNQVMLRDQEGMPELLDQGLYTIDANAEPHFNCKELISYHPIFGIEAERNEYIYAFTTLYNSVKNGRVYKKQDLTATESVFIDDFETLYNYFGKLLGGGGAHNIEYAEFGAQTVINQTVGMDFLESIKVVMDDLMKNGQKETIETRMDKGILEEVDQVKTSDKTTVWQKYFEDTVAYIPREDAKDNLEYVMGLLNRYNQVFLKMASEQQDMKFNGIDWELTPENLIYRYVHVYDEVNSLDNIMKALGYNCETETKTR